MFDSPLPQPVPLENALRIVSEVVASYRGTRADHQMLDTAMGTILGEIKGLQHEVLELRKKVAPRPSDDSAEVDPDRVGLTD